MQLEKHPLKELIAGGESCCLDFKYHIGDSRKIAKTLVAFANTRGGKLLLGVKDNGKIIGVESDEEIYMVETAARYFCKPYIPFTTHEWAYEDKTVLEVDIPKSEGKPHYVKDEDAKWWVYLRVNDKNKFANRVVIEYLRRLQKHQNTFIHYSKKENLLLEFLNNNGHITFKKFKNMARIRPRKAENILINLASIGVISIHHNEKFFYYKLATKNDPDALFDNH